MLRKKLVFLTAGSKTLSFINPARFQTIMYNSVQRFYDAIFQVSLSLFIFISKSQYLMEEAITGKLLVSVYMIKGVFIIFCCYVYIFTGNIGLVKAWKADPYGNLVYFFFQYLSHPYSLRIFYFIFVVS